MTVFCSKEQAALSLGVIANGALKCTIGVLSAKRAGLLLPHLDLDLDFFVRLTVTRPPSSGKLDVTSFSTAWDESLKFTLLCSAFILASLNLVYVMN